jgi:hypothetical protein
LLEKEVAIYRNAETTIKHNYLAHENIRMLDIFILIAALGSMILIKYRLNQDNEVAGREEFVLGPGSADVIVELQNW